MVVTCKIKHFYVYGIATGSRRSKIFLQMFYFTCNHYLRAVFDPAKNVLQHFCKCFSVKRFEAFLEVVACKIKH